MDVLDLIIAGVAISAAVGGFLLGFLARAVSWLGLGVGLLVAARLLPSIIDAFKTADPTGKLLVAALVLLGGSFLGQAAGLLLGARIHGIVPLGALRRVDDGFGAAFGLIGVLVAVWLLLPSMASVPGWPARQARHSSIARWVDRNFPAPPNTLEALRHLVGDNNFPQVFNSLTPSVDTGPAPATTGMTPTQELLVAASTVKVEGDACGRIQEGSGWTVAPGYVLTNAHVVAGERQTEVQLPAGRVLPGVVVAFDAGRDLALIDVPGLTETQLPLYSGAATVDAQDAVVGRQGAVFGHPGGEAQLAITPFLVRQYVSALGRDLYDEHDTKRDVFVLASNLAPGDSGGAVVDKTGTVIAMAFAIAPDRPGTSYALSYTEVQAFLAASRAGTIPGDAVGQPPIVGVSTGPCLSD